MDTKTESHLWKWGFALTLAGILGACGTRQPATSNQTAPKSSKAQTAHQKTTSPQAGRPAVQSRTESRTAFLPVSKDRIETLGRGINAFSVDVYKLLAPGKGNIFFSPWGISMALAMTHLGAKGETAAEMEQALHFPDEKLDESFATLQKSLLDLPKGNRLEMANRIFPQVSYPLLAGFVESLKRLYATTVQPVDYVKAAAAAVSAINAWVKSATRGKISRLLSPGDVDVLTRLVLVNTVFFKGIWKNKFKKRATHKEPFYPGPGQKVQVDMMGATIKTKYRHGPGFKALSLHYSGEKLSMVILLPDRKDGLADMEKRLDTKTIEAATRNMPLRTVRVWLPRFHAKQKLRLRSVLAKLGVKLAFSQGKADFSGITNKKPGLFISAVVHQADCDVDEDGTVASAATVVVARARGRVAFHPRSYVFRADHPFLFFIRDDASGTILFMGRIVKP